MEGIDWRATTHLEVRPVVPVFGPTLQHQLEDVSGTVVGLAQHLGQSLGVTELREVLHHLLIAERLVRQLPGEGEDLPERHPEGPDVAPPGVLLAQQGLPAEPSDWQPGGPVVVRAVVWLDGSSVGYFDVETTGDLAVPTTLISLAPFSSLFSNCQPCCQVFVNEVKGFQALHSRGNLCCHVHQSTIAGNEIIINLSSTDCTVCCVHFYLRDGMSEILVAGDSAT